MTLASEDITFLHFIIFQSPIRNGQLSVHFSASGDFSSLSEISALIIFRIIQECVQNVLKHTRASRLDLSMMAEQSDLEMTIEDNGKGFEMTLINPGSIGLKNIRSRVAYLGGKAEIDSRPGQGTVLAFHIPLSKH